MSATTADGEMAAQEWQAMLFGRAKGIRENLSQILAAEGLDVPATPRMPLSKEEIRSLCKWKGLQMSEFRNDVQVRNNRDDVHFESNVDFLSAVLGLDLSTAETPLSPILLAADPGIYTPDPLFIEQQQQQLQQQQQQQDMLHHHQQQLEQEKDQSTDKQQESHQSHGDLKQQQELQRQDDHHHQEQHRLQQGKQSLEHDHDQHHESQQELQQEQQEIPKQTKITLMGADHVRLSISGVATAMMSPRLTMQRSPSQMLAGDSQMVDQGNAKLEAENTILRSQLQRRAKDVASSREMATKTWEKMKQVRNEVQPLEDMWKRQQLVNVDSMRKDIAFYEKEREYLYSKIFGCDIDFTKGNEPDQQQQREARPTRNTFEAEKKTLNKKIAYLAKQASVLKRKNAELIYLIRLDEAYKMSQRDFDAGKHKRRHRRGHQGGRASLRSSTGGCGSNEVPDYQMQYSGDTDFSSSDAEEIEPASYSKNIEWMRADNESAVIDDLLTRIPGSDPNFNKCFGSILSKVFNTMSSLDSVRDNTLEGIRAVVPNFLKTGVSEFNRKSHNQYVEERVRLVHKLKHLIPMLQVGPSVNTTETVSTESQTTSLPGDMLCASEFAYAATGGNRPSKNELRGLEAGTRCVLCHHLVRKDYETDTDDSMESLEDPDGNTPEGLRTRHNRKKLEAKIRTEIRKELEDQGNRVEKELEGLTRSAMKAVKSKRTDKHDRQIELLENKVKVLENFIRTKYKMMETQALSLHHTLFRIMKRLGDELHVPDFAMPTFKTPKYATPEKDSDMARFEHVTRIIRDDEVGLKKFWNYLHDHSNPQAIAKMRATNESASKVTSEEQPTPMLTSLLASGKLALPLSTPRMKMETPRGVISSCNMSPRDTVASKTDASDEMSPSATFVSRRLNDTLDNTRRKRKVIKGIYRERTERRRRFQIFCTTLKAQEYDDFTQFFVKYTESAVGLRRLRAILDERKQQTASSVIQRPNAPPVESRFMKVLKCSDCKRPLTSSPFCPKTGVPHLGDMKTPDRAKETKIGLQRTVEDLLRRIKNTENYEIENTPEVAVSPPKTLISSNSDILGGSELVVGVKTIRNQLGDQSQFNKSINLLHTIQRGFTKPKTTRLLDDEIPPQAASSSFIKRITPPETNQTKPVLTSTGFTAEFNDQSGGLTTGSDFVFGTPNRKQSVFALDSMQKPSRAEGEQNNLTTFGMDMQSSHSMLETLSNRSRSPSISRRRSRSPSHVEPSETFESDTFTRELLAANTIGAPPEYQSSRSLVAQHFERKRSVSPQTDPRIREPDSIDAGDSMLSIGLNAVPFTDTPADLQINQPRRASHVPVEKQKSQPPAKLGEQLQAVGYTNQKEPTSGKVIQRKLVVSQPKGQQKLDSKTKTVTSTARSISPTVGLGFGFSNVLSGDSLSDAASRNGSPFATPMRGRGSPQSSALEVSVERMTPEGLPHVLDSTRISPKSSPLRNQIRPVTRNLSGVKKTDQLDILKIQAPKIAARKNITQDQQVGFNLLKIGERIGNKRTPVAGRLQADRQPPKFNNNLINDRSPMVTASTRTGVLAGPISARAVKGFTPAPIKRATTPAAHFPLISSSQDVFATSSSSTIPKKQQQQQQPQLQKSHSKQLYQTEPPPQVMEPLKSSVLPCKSQVVINNLEDIRNPNRDPLKIAIDKLELGADWYKLLDSK